MTRKKHRFPPPKWHPRNAWLTMVNAKNGHSAMQMRAYIAVWLKPKRKVAP
jgi:hypothetical protein